MEKRYWQDSHITKKDGKYKAWDETGVDTIGDFDTREKAREALSQYSLQLDGNYSDNGTKRKYY